MGRDMGSTMCQKHEADQSTAVAAQLGGPFVAEYVEGDEDRLPRRVGDARLGVQDAADRRFTDTGLLRDIRQTR